VETKKVPIIINGLLSLLLLYYISIQVPFFGIVIGALMPLPTMLVIRRAGWLAGILLVGTGLGVIHYVERFFGLGAEVLPFLHMAVIAFAISFFASRHYRLEVIVGGAVLLAAGLQAGAFIMQAWQLGLSPQDHLHQGVREVWTAFEKLLEQEKVLEQEIPLGGMSVDEVSTLIARIFPALLLINNMVVVLVNYRLSWHLADGSHRETLQTPLTHWETPDWLIFVLIASGFMLFVPIPGLHLVGLNALMVCSLLYFFQGLAILGFIFQRFQAPWFFRWSVYLLLILIKPALLLMILIGLTDLWFDFRRLRQLPPED